MKITGTGFSTIPGANVVTFNNVRGAVDPAQSTATTLVVKTPPFTTTGAVEVRTPDGLARSSTELVFPSTVLTAADLTPIRRITIGGASTNVTVNQDQAALVVFQGTKGQIVQVSFTGYTGTTSEAATLREPFDRELARVLLFNPTESMSATLPHDGDYAIRVYNDFQPTPWSVTVSVTQTGTAPRLATPSGSSSDTLPDGPALEAVRLNGPVTPDVWLPDVTDPRGWVTDFEPSVFEQTELPSAPQGVTAVAGRVLSIDGQPLADVPVRLVETDGGYDDPYGADPGASDGYGYGDGYSTPAAVTDEIGRFVLEDVPAGRVEIYVDGAAMPREDISFGSFLIGVDTERGRTVELERPVWLPRVDESTSTDIAFPTNRKLTLTHPSMPGLEVHIPKNTRIRSVDGDPVRELSLTPLPMDRAPFPLPEGVNPPSYWTVQPGGATLSKGAKVVYPAPESYVPGQRSDFYIYEPDEGWEPYGTGRVDETGQQSVPDLDARVYEFNGAMLFGAIANWFQDLICGGGGSTPTGTVSGPADPSEGGSCFGDPVDVGSGLVGIRQRDLYEPGPMPIDLTRVYRQNDANRSYQFGLGVTTRYEMFLRRVDQASACRVDLFVPGERRVRFVSPNWPSNPPACDLGPSAVGSNVLTTQGAVGSLAGSTLGYSTSWYGSTAFPNSELVGRDGMIYTFDGLTGVLESVRDGFNNEIYFPGTGNSAASWQPGSILAYPSARFVGFTYNGDEMVTQAFDAHARTVAYTYEKPAVDLSRLVSITDAEQTTKPSPASWALDWNNSTTLNANPSSTPSPGTQLLTITDPRSNVALTNRFDAQGRVDRQTLANSGQFNYEYSSTDANCTGQTKLTDPNGNISCFATNGEGFLTQRKVGVGLASGTRTFDYVRNVTTNRLESVTDSFTLAGGGSRSRTTSYGYNTKGQVTSIGRTIKRPGGATDTLTTSFTYHGATGGLASITDPLSHATTFTYSGGCTSKITDDLGNFVDMTCTSAGLPKTVVSHPTSGSNLTTTMNYARGDLLRVEDPLGRRTGQLADAAGRPVVITDPLRYRTVLRWSNLDDPTRITDALGNAVDLTYDANRNLTKVELPPATGTSGPRGTTTYAYDAMNRLQTRTDQLGQSNPSGHQDVYTRDLNGNVLTWTNRRGQVMRFCYDAFDRRTFAGYAASGGSPTCASTFQSTTAFTWDGWGRLTKVDDTVGGVLSTITRDYDDLDRLTNEATPYGSVAYTWDDASRRDTVTVAGQTSVDYDWFRNDLLKQVAQGTATVSMAYDQANRLDTTTLANGIVQDHALDGAGGISQISYDKGATAYGKINHASDTAGRRTKMWGSYGRITLPAATTANAVYDLANRLTSWNGQAVTHDADGNLTAIGTQTSSWNARGQLTATSAGNVGYGYDGLGRRVTRSVSGAANARFVYDGWNLVQEQSGTGTVTANSMLGLGLGQVFRRTETSGTTRNYLTDAMGSTLALTSGMATPTVNTEYSYEPYGKPTITGSATTNPFAFTGLAWDTGSSVYDNRFRQLNPAVGRFGSEDPIDVLGGWNLYSYAGDAPSRLADHLGLDPDGCSWSCAFGIIGSIVTIAGLVFVAAPVLGPILGVIGLGVSAGLAINATLSGSDSAGFLWLTTGAGALGSLLLPVLIATNPVGAIAFSIAIFAVTVTLAYSDD